MKKPFAKRTIGKILLNPIVKTVLTSIPGGVGKVAGAVLNKNATEPGTPAGEDVRQAIFEMVVTAVLLYLILTGKIDLPQAEDLKDFATQ